MSIIRFISMSSLVLLGGCTTFDDVVAAVNAYWNTILCWFLSAFGALFQGLIDFATNTIVVIASALPTVNLPAINLDSNMMSAIAYFVPISEMSLVVVSVLSAIMGGYVFLVILRWLKVIK